VSRSLDCTGSANSRFFASVFVRSHLWFFGMRDAYALLVKVFMFSALVVSVAAYIYAASAVALFLQGSSTPVGGRKGLDQNSNPNLLRVFSTFAVGLASSTSRSDSVMNRRSSTRRLLAGIERFAYFSETCYQLDYIQTSISFSCI
jgi:hypothetical protein